MSSGRKTKSQQSSNAESRVQFSLRLPEDLHARLVERAGLVPLNSFIIQTLETAIDTNEKARLAEKLMQHSSSLQEKLDKISESDSKRDAKFQEIATRIAETIRLATREAVMEAFAMQIWQNQINKKS